MEEFHIQRAFCIWFDDPQGKVPPAKKPGVQWWHTPNGGARDAREGARFKLLGVRAGIPDLLFLWGGLFGLEFKKPGGRLSDVQKDLHPQLLAAGMVACATVDNLQDAKNFVRRHGLTVNE